MYGVRVVNGHTLWFSVCLHAAHVPHYPPSHANAISVACPRKTTRHNLISFPYSQHHNCKCPSICVAAPFLLDSCSVALANERAHWHWHRRRRRRRPATGRPPARARASAPLLRALPQPKPASFSWTPRARRRLPPSNPHATSSLRSLSANPRGQPRTPLGRGQAVWVAFPRPAAGSAHQLINCHWPRDVMLPARDKCGPLSLRGGNKSIKIAANNKLEQVGVG